MAITPNAFTPEVFSPTAFSQFASDTNVPGASTSYQSFLTTGRTIAPVGVRQIGPFAFDYEGDDNVTHHSDITDHWVESNDAVQDHIGNQPVVITLKGVVSELVFSRSVATALVTALTSVENALSQTDAYLGSYTPGVTQKLQTTISQAQNIAVQIEQAASRTAQIASFFFPQGSKQQQAYAVLSSLQLARILFTVYTPFQVFANMAIEDFSITQPGWTKTQSTVTVRMKQLQFTNNISQAFFLTQYGGRASVGYQPTVPSGLTSGVPAALSKVTSAFSAF